MSRRYSDADEYDRPQVSRISEAEWKEFSGFTESLNQKLEKSFGKSITAFKTKLAGATEPSFPRTEIVQQIKQTAMSMYTASEFICKEVCDVADNAALIPFCFAIGVQALIQETMRLLKMDLAQDTVDRIVIDVMEGVVARKSTKVSFSEVDVEPYIRRLINAFGIDSEFRPESPRTPQVVVVNPSGAEFYSNQVASPFRALIAPTGADTPPRPISPTGPARSILSPVRLAPPPMSVIPHQQSSSSPLSAILPRETQRPSPVRKANPFEADVDEARYLSALALIGINNRYQSYQDALVEVTQATQATKVALSAFKEARNNQRFSQSQGI